MQIVGSLIQIFKPYSSANSNLKDIVTFDFEQFCMAKLNFKSKKDHLKERREWMEGSWREINDHWPFNLHKALQPPLLQTL